MELSRRFELAARTDDSLFRDLISLHTASDREPIEQILLFCIYNREAILKELAFVRGMGGWTLELTVTSLWSLLTTWGDKFTSLDVRCDRSVPLLDQRKYFDMMVGRTDKAYIAYGGKRRQVLFNLARPIELVDSDSHPGIQLADVMAAVACYCLDNEAEMW